ncbi:unnamed protein product [Adineta ricciae]|uniref:EGF-like domain-containing protein n=1 Tax=Adineta ricciae TaxID=249248 RepID=A0A813QRC9_ADIRI|nr:unnamed protein product [Adineta ricciae]
MFLIVLPYVELKIYLYSAQDGQPIEYYDYVMIESLFYCRRPEEPIDLHRDNVTESCEKNGVSTVLHEWKSTLEHVERYSRYLRGSSQLDGHLCQCLQSQSFGKNCEYHLPVGTTLQDALEWQLKISGRVATSNAFGTDLGLRKGPEYGECRSQRDQRFVCETYCCWLMWTLSNGQCCFERPCKESQIRNNTIHEQCQLLLRCILSENTASGCSHWDDTDYPINLSDYCPLELIPYPQGPIISSYGSYFFNRERNWTHPFPDWIFINGTVRCGDALVSTTQRIQFTQPLRAGTSVRAERFCFHCSNNQLTCLSVTVLGDDRHDCPNQFDELWLGTNRRLSEMKCDKQHKDECALVRHYFDQSSRLMNNDKHCIETHIAFLSYCNTFWNTGSQKDENQTECRRWWVCADDQWQCRTGQCVLKNWVNDEEWDCTDASDEAELFNKTITLLEAMKLDFHASKEFEPLFDTFFRLAKVLQLDRLSTFRHHNSCSSNFCHEKAECHSLLNDPSKYLCLCPNNFTGANCSVEDLHCTNDYCAPTTLCNPFPYCVCPFNRYGERCDIEHDRCQLTACLNGGSCFPTSAPDRVICLCTEHFYGSQCQWKKTIYHLPLENQIQYGAAVVQYYDIDLISLDLIFVHQQVYQTLPSSLEYRYHQERILDIIIGKFYTSFLEQQRISIFSHCILIVYQRFLSQLRRRFDIITSVLKIQLCSVFMTISTSVFATRIIHEWNASIMTILWIIARTVSRVVDV